MRIIPEDDRQPSEAEMQAWQDNPFHDDLPDDLIQSARSSGAPPLPDLDAASLLRRANDVIRAVEAAPDGYPLGAWSEEIAALIRRVAASAYMEVLLHHARTRKERGRLDRPQRTPWGVRAAGDDGGFPELYRNPDKPRGEKQRRFEKRDIAIAYEIVRRFREKLNPHRAFNPWANIRLMKTADAFDADAAFFESACIAAGLVEKDEPQNRCSGHVEKLRKGR